MIPGSPEDIKIPVPPSGMVSPMSGLGTPAEPASPNPNLNKSLFNREVLAKDHIPVLGLGTPARAVTPEITVNRDHVTKAHHHDEDI
jgi:hypothetical protein